EQEAHEAAQHNDGGSSGRVFASKLGNRSARRPELPHRSPGLLRSLVHGLLGLPACAIVELGATLRKRLADFGHFLPQIGNLLLQRFLDFLWIEGFCHGSISVVQSNGATGWRLVGSAALPGGPEPSAGRLRRGSAVRPS